MNGHIGNERLRTLAQERKRAFDAGSYTEKRQLATEIVQIIRSLDPPGRFLKRVTPSKASSSSSSKPTTDGNNPVAAPKDGGAVPSENGSIDNGPSEVGGEPGQPEQHGEASGGAREEGGPNIVDGIWEELSDEMSIHKTCQVMRDIARPDRKHREERRLERKRIKMLGGTAAAAAAAKADEEPVEDERLVPEESAAGADGDEVKADEVVTSDDVVAVDGCGSAIDPEIPGGDGTTEGGMKDEVETKDVEMKDVSSLAEEAAVEVVDNALDGTPTEQATTEIPAEAGAIEV